MPGIFPTSDLPFHPQDITFLLRPFLHFQLSGGSERHGNSTKVTQHATGVVSVLKQVSLNIDLVLSAAWLPIPKVQPQCQQQLSLRIWKCKFSSVPTPSER